MSEKKKKLCVDTEPEKCFWVCDGSVLKNLCELAAALETMNEPTFKYHVNKEKNDFANWVRDVFGDQKLAKGLMKAKTAKATAKQVRARI